MSRDLKFLLQIAAEDQASNKVSQIGRQAERSSRNVAQQNKRTAQETIRANEDIKKSTVSTAQSSEQSAQRVAAMHKRMSQDRERLGIRSEERIRREIVVTEQAYKRLVQTGKLSANEQARAYDSMRNKVSGLKKELEGAVFQQSRLGKGLSVGKSVAQSAMALGTGIAAASYVMAKPVKRTMDYEQRLAYMANTAYDGEGLEAKKAGRETLRNAVNEAAKYGGNKEDAAEALNELIASGTVSKDTAMNILPELQKVAIANNGSSVDMAKIAIAAMQNFKIDEKDLPQLFDIAAKSAASGSFEMADLARWLPNLMAAGSTAGMSGIEDFKVLATAAQTAKFTASSSDEAGNNLKNLLLKINHQETATKAKNIEIAPGKSIDLTGSIARARSEGKNSLDAFIGIVEQVVGKDKRYQELKTKMANADEKSPEYKQMLESMSSLLQGSAIGQLVSDQQALMALVGYMNAEEFRKQAKQDLDNAAGTNNENYASMADTAANKAEKLANAQDNAEYEAFKGLTDVVGETALKLSEYANQYPGLTSFLVGTTTIIKSLGVAAGGAALALSVLGGKNILGGILGRSAVAATGAKVAAGVGSKSVASVGGLSKGLKVASPIIAGGLVVADAAINTYDIATSDMNDKEKTDAYIGVAKDTAVTGVGMWGGAKAGAALGSLAGPWGAAIGGVIGAVVGPAALDAVVDGISGFFSNDPKVSESKPKEFAPQIESGGTQGYPKEADILKALEQYSKPQTFDPAVYQALENSVLRAVEQARQTPQALNIHTTVDVQNGNIVATVNALNSQEARRY